MAKSERAHYPIYRQTATFPRHEFFGLVSQLRRAAVSVASNIAEGQGRLTTGEFQHYLGIARGSLLETQLSIAEELGDINEESGNALRSQTGEVLYLLNRLLKSLHERAEAVCANR